MLATVVIMSLAVVRRLLEFTLSMSLLRIRSNTCAESLVLLRVREICNTVIPMRLVVSFRIGVPNVTCLVTLWCR